MRIQPIIFFAVVASGCGGTIISGAGGGAGSNTGALDLPCDVAAVVSSACIQCHSASPAPGAVRLTSRADFVAASSSDPSKSYGQLALVRMQETGVSGAMPPSGPLSQSAISAMQTWVNGGMPAGSCQTSGTGGGGGSGNWQPGASGLPCDVASFVSAKCISCHSPGGASVPLTTRDAFLASSTTPGQTVGQLAVSRLASVTSPMPPVSAPSATGAEIATFDSWVDAGMPLGTCGAIDAGVPEPTCASNSYWTRGNRESRDMNPGLACLTCHATQEANKRYPFSGTVYPSLHEKDLCNATVPSGVRVEIYDSTGALALTMVPSAASGNFNSSLNVSVSLPYTARVVSSAGVLAMTQPQRSGDCNSCHTVQGAFGAYGRIVWK